MKIRKLGFILLVATLIMSLAACSQAKTLEEYLSKDKNAMQEIQDIATQADMQVDIKENTITYTYDISNINASLTEEMVKTDEFKSSMETALDGTAETFVGLCEEIEKETKLKGIKMVVKYVYKDNVITEREFSAES